VQSDISSQDVNFAHHRVVIFQKLLCLLRLVIQLSGERMILEDSEPSAGLELLVVQSHKVGLGLFDLEVHLLVQSLDSIDFISFHIIDFLHTFFLLNLKGFLSVLHFLGNLVSEFLSTLLIV